MRAKEVEVNFNPVSRLRVGRLDQELDCYRIDKANYQGRYAHLEDQRDITPAEKTYLVFNGVRWRDRVGKVSLSEWEARTLSLSADDREKVEAFFRSNPHWSAAELLNIMELCDDQEIRCSLSLGQRSLFRKGKNAGFLVRNMAKVCRSLRYQALPVEKSAAPSEEAANPKILPETLDPLFYPVKRSYLALRHRKQPAYDPRSLFDYDFNQAAIQARQLSANPHRFVEIQFETHSDRHDAAHPPSPSYLHRDEAADRYQQVVQRYPRTSGELCFINEIRVIQDFQRMYPNRTLDEILSLEFIPCKAWTRIIFAETCPDDLLYAFGNHARTLVQYDPSLEDYLRSFYIGQYSRLGIPESPHENWHYQHPAAMATVKTHVEGGGHESCV